MAMAASDFAVRMAGLEIAPDFADAAGVYIGSGIGGFDVIEREHSKYLNGGPGKISPFFIPSAIVNLAAGNVSIRYGAKGPNSATATACSAGAHAVGDAYKIIQRCDAEVMIAGGSEAAVTPMSIGGFGAMRALSTRNDEPERASRPFDAGRDGFVVGEGSGILILESLEFAERRGANIIAEIVGYGMSGDAYHITQPAEGGDGGYRVSLAAIKDAKITPDDVSYVNAHGTSTPMGDAIETSALKPRLRRAREKSSHQLDQVDDRPSSWRRGRPRGRHQRAGAARSDPSADDQSGDARSRVRSRLRPESRAEGGSRLRAFEFLRLRRHERVVDFQALGRTVTMRPASSS